MVNIILKGLQMQKKGMSTCSFLPFIWNAAAALLFGSSAHMRVRISITFFWMPSSSVPIARCLS